MRTLVTVSALAVCPSVAAYFLASLSVDFGLSESQAVGIAVVYLMTVITIGVLFLAALEDVFRRRSPE